MVAHDHYQRLKHLYAADAAEPVTGSIEISYGHAELAGTVGEAAQSPFFFFISDPTEQV